MGSSRIDLLLNYAQIDVLDSHKQATAFDLIKAMIGQKIENQKVKNYNFSLIQNFFNKCFSKRLMNLSNIWLKMQSPRPLPVFVCNVDRLLLPNTMRNLKLYFYQTILLYLTVHPSGKKSILHWVEFFIDQLDYELESGRMSSLEMIHAILNAFVEVMLRFKT